MRGRNVTLKFRLLIFFEGFYFPLRNNVRSRRKDGINTAFLKIVNFFFPVPPYLGSEISYILKVSGQKKVRVLTCLSLKARF
tara:strand:- start:7418 stop:7663 length:246 start_codon:yes stop_codon:yes gene_type:complete